MAPIERVTLFNIPKEEDRARLVESYKQLIKDATKNGKPYITNASFGPGIPDKRSKEYNFSVKLTFASLEDMKFYDTECQAHKALKGFVTQAKQGDALVVYFENTL